MIGLSTAEAQQRLDQGLGNTQVDNTAKTTKDILKENIFTYFNLIFLILAILLMVAGAWNSLTFLPVIIANACIGIYQEINSKKVLDKLSVLNEQSATAIRDGQEKIIPIRKLVKDDVILLTAGNQICADAILIDGELAVNEALLTGEADEINKVKGDELMSGSFVISGRGLARLVNVGSESYISKLMIKAKKMPSKQKSEMIKAIDRIVIAAGIAIIPIGIALFVQSFVFNRMLFQESVTAMVAAVIGMIPEGLYLLVSIALAMSTVRLAKRKVMLHDMRSIETLARVDTICVDKTGTITDNSMLVADIVLADEGSDRDLVEYKAIVSDYVSCIPDNNITMQALDNYFDTKTIKKCLAFHPFSSKYKYSSVKFAEGSYCLGAPEFVLGPNFEQYAEKVNSYAAKGLRVLVFAHIPGPDESTPADLPDESLDGITVKPLVFILLQNPIRETAPETFAYFVKQGVDVKVISGDNPVTVSEVAKTAGILNADQFIDAQLLTTDDKIAEAVKKYTVFGRVTPEQKQKIIRALKKDGHTVAMTGDGVNDILAMKDADCSVAMAAGSEAAVQAAQVVLLDSDFSHMPQIVSEGRRNINNIERSATLFLVKNIFSLLLAVFSIINVMNYPLVPSQITMISMFNIGIPGFFLAMEPNNKRIEGRFFIKVMLKAMPAALTDFFAIAALVIFGDTFNVSTVDISVASTFLMIIVGFMILGNTIQPFNRYRVRVIVGCFIGFIVACIFFNSLFSITYMTKECIMLFVVFAIATEPCMRYLTVLFEKLEEKIQSGIKKRSLNEN